MHYDTFLSYNVFGGFIWVTGLTFAGYFLGGLPIVKNNFETAIYGLVALSLLPVAIEFIKHKFFDQKTKKKDSSINYKEIKETFKEERLS
jgi:membrane-associated protein